ncbi:MAG: Sec-independent protein translocase protein TatB [Planktomarina sp.]|nr:Sec-independent protein translocase protein TatB [Planktomarina sp.]
MFGLGWAEILVAAVVGLIVIGPKELPGVFRKIGQFVGKAKGMARDFSRAMNDAADEAGVKDAMDSVNTLKDGVRSVSDPTTKWKDFVPGPELGKLSKERAEQAKKIHDAMAETALKRMDAEQVKKAAAAEESQKPAPAKKPAAAKKTAATKKPAAAKKPAASPKKPAAKKAASKPGKIT